MQACDNGSPVRCINTTVTLTVDRTGQPPIFTRNQYTQIIEENKAVGDSVIFVTANDANKLVSLETSYLYCLVIKIHYFFRICMRNCIDVKLHYLILLIYEIFHIFRIILSLFSYCCYVVNDLDRIF